MPDKTHHSLRVVPGSGPTEITLAVLGVRLENLTEQVSEIDRKLEKTYVTHEAFKPVKTVVYSCVALVLAAVATGVVGLVVHGVK